MLGTLRRWLRGSGVSLWHHASYRLPIPALESSVRFDTRRCDVAAWYLLDSRAIEPESVRTPERIGYPELTRVHPYEWIVGLNDPDRLARVFQLHPREVPVQEVITAMRLSCGGTLGAARETLRTRRPGLNMLGGFHHAAPTRAAGFCAFNDVAVAVKALRGEGTSGRVAILDLDAHPPDGTAECLRDDPGVWIGSLSGSDWGPLPGVDETVLPPGCPDAPYLDALEALLFRMPKPEIAFVLAGGDVLAGDRLGTLGLTLDGARRRDIAVARALAGVPQVWLSAGGYHRDAWRVLAGTGLVLAGLPKQAIPGGADPMAGRFARLALGLDRGQLAGGGDLFDARDLEDALGMTPRAVQHRLLGYYTAEGMELKLETFGVLPAIRRLGYVDLRVEVESTEGDDRLRVRGRWRRQEHLLIEAAMARLTVHGYPMFFVNWLTLRHPAARFTSARPQLPGQDVPGLGLLAETGHLLTQMARRLGLAGVAFRPAHYHLAFVSRHHCRFIDPRREGRFRAMERDLGELPLLEVAHAIEEGRVRLDGEPYAWEPEMTAMWVDTHPQVESWEEAAAGEKARCRFTILPPPGSAGSTNLAPRGAQGYPPDRP